MKLNQSVAKQELTSIVDLVKPAVAGQSYIDALTRIAFTGEYAVAYNDILAIARPCTLPLGCVPGELLSKTLATIISDEVLLQAEREGELLLSAGRTKMKIPTLPVTTFPFEFQTDGYDVALTNSVLAGIELCLVGVGSDPTHPAQMGVTLEGGERARLFSTDNYTISRFTTESNIKLQADVPLLLPTEFCRQLLVLANAFSGDKVTLEVFPTAITAHIGEQARLFSKLLVDVTPLDFDAILAKHRINDEKPYQAIPNVLDGAFERAALVLSKELDKTTTMSVTGNRLSLFSKSALGEAADTCSFKYPDTSEFHIDPTRVARALKLTSKMALLENILVLSSDDEDFTHLIAHCVV